MRCEGSGRKAKWLTKCNLRHGICAVCNMMRRTDKEGRMEEHEV